MAFVFQHATMTSMNFVQVHIGAFYQLFVRLSTATSFELISGNIDVPLGQLSLDSGETWQKFELCSFKLKIFTSKTTKNGQFSLVFDFFTQPCIL